MAKLDDIVQQVAVEGTGEAGATLQELAHVAVSAFEKISAAAEGGAAGFALLGTGALAVVAALAVATYAMYEFAKSSSEAIIQLDGIGKAMGTTAGSVAGLEMQMAKFGISQQSAERMMERGAINLARQWSGIVDAYEQGGNKIAAAMTGIKGAHLHLEEAMNNSWNSSKEWSQKLRGDALSVADALLKVQHSAAEAASEVQHNASSVKSAEFGLQEAEAKLREMRTGEKENPQDKVNREYLKQIQAVEDAKQRVTDAQQKQMRDAQSQPLRQQRDQLGVEQAQFRQSKDQEAAALAPEKVALEVSKARESIVEAIHNLGSIQHADLGTILSNLHSGNLQELLKSTPENIAKAIKLEAGQDAIKAGKAMPELPDVLVKAAEIYRSIGQELPGAIKQAITQDIAPSRGADTSKINNMLESASTDIRKVVDAWKEAIPPETVKQAYTNIGAAAEASTRMKLAADEAGVAVGGKLVDGANSAAASLKALSEAAAKMAAPNAGSNVTGDMGSQPMADGGEVRGPGGATSDSIPARLSNGEFVVRAAAVRTYGTDLLHSINEMRAQGFALGGYVSTFRGARAADTGIGGGGSSVLNLTIDGQKFGGLRAPNDVAAKLSHYAISRQMSSTGDRPSWVR